ncbi:hypothetical protein NQ317_009851 [Molorchus minor]|uniref:Uncharacterized protein n=1 Tax=Molorchus minor TaxID=1323400 RepID=A0ABQ9K4U1_9CUCU|nr:hypothetical protein NQ317_009851 [Molorchus minor]
MGGQGLQESSLGNTLEGQSFRRSFAR